LVRLGWSHGDQEIFSMDEMLELFDPSDINRSASVYNTDKLDWLSSHYLKNTSNSELCTLLEFHGITLVSHDKREILLDVIKERAKTLVEMASLVNEVLVRPSSFDEVALKKGFKEDSPEVLENFSTALQNANELHLPSDYHAVMEKVVTDMGIGFGKIGQPLRIALLGKLSGPGLDSVMAIIGVEETLQRIQSLLKR
jgi:glutamyl-tRNA synthetase